MVVASFSPELLLRIATHVQLSVKEIPRSERMGFLLGKKGHGVFSVEAYSPYKGGFRGSSYFDYESDKVKNRAVELTKQTGLDFLGLYHSHPLLGKEKVPNDIIEITDQSVSDRDSFLEDRWMPMGLIVGIARGKQALNKFSLKINKIWFIRHTGGLMQVICADDCRRIWVILGRLSCLFLWLAIRVVPEDSLCL